MPRGWPIVAWAALAVATMIAVIIAVAGGGEDGIRMVIRATARTSVVLFGAAFVASALHRAWPGGVTRWLVANRRYVGVSFAVSHFAHLFALLALAEWSLSGMAAAATPTVLILGGIAYILLAVMVATSFDRTAAWLGPRSWSRLHTTGMYWLWFIFFASFAPKAPNSPLYAVLTLGLLTTLALRIRYRPAAVPTLAARATAR
jgi:DMSO/TMAO reductase YedYZ heme-binding membrane subunit